VQECLPSTKPEELLELLRILGNPQEVLDYYLDQSKHRKKIAQYKQRQKLVNKRAKTIVLAQRASKTSNSWCNTSEDTRHKLGNPHYKAQDHQFPKFIKVKPNRPKGDWNSNLSISDQLKFDKLIEQFPEISYDTLQSIFEQFNSNFTATVKFLVESNKQPNPPSVLDQVQIPYHNPSYVPPKPVQVKPDPNQFIEVKRKQRAPRANKHSDDEDGRNENITLSDLYNGSFSPFFLTLDVDPRTRAQQLASMRAVYFRLAASAFTSKQGAVAREYARLVCISYPV
jgi:hypothetical protein